MELKNSARENEIREINALSLSCSCGEDKRDSMSIKIATTAGEEGVQIGKERSYSQGRE